MPRCRKRGGSCLGVVKGLLPGLSVIVAVSLKWRITARCFWMNWRTVAGATGQLLRVLYGDIQRVGDDRNYCAWMCEVLARR